MVTKARKEIINKDMDGNRSNLNLFVSHEI